MKQELSYAYLIFTVVVGILLLILAWFACRGLYIDLVVYAYPVAVSNWDWILGIAPIFSLLVLWGCYRWQSRIDSPLKWWILGILLLLNLGLPMAAGGIFWGSFSGAPFG